MLTRSEIFALAKKACRGSGFSWGMAEEAGRATVRCFASGSDGFAALVEILDHAQGKTHPMDCETGPTICGLTFAVYNLDIDNRNVELPDGLVGVDIALAILRPADQNPSWPAEPSKTISDYAFKTYVPDSEESRRRGAG